VLWTIVVINLGNVGITLSLPEQFWLTAVPNLIGSALRIPYTFAVPRFGGRAWTTISASLLFIPALLLFAVIPFGAPVPVNFDFTLGPLGRFVHHVDERARLVGRGRVDQLAQQLEQLGAPAGLRPHRRRVGDQLSNFSLSAATVCS